MSELVYSKLQEAMIENLFSALQCVLQRVFSIVV